MTKRENDYFDYHKQCNTCNYSNEVARKIHDWFAEIGPQYTELSRRLKSEFDISVSADALSNHLKFHSKEDKQPQTLLGVVKPPKGWEPRVDIDGNSGEVTSTPQKNGKLTDFSQILDEFDIDPDSFEVVGPARLSKWQTFDGEWLTSYKFRIEKKNASGVELTTLFDEVRKNDRPKAEIRFANGGYTGKNPDRTLVVPFADLQVGKVGSRGGTIELIDRVQEKKEKLLDYIKKENCATALFADAGDIVENFENTAQQSHTNDLSLMEQLDLAATLEEEFIELVAREHNHTDITGVPSNHASWRKGKDVLGKPSDDWGIFILKQIQKSYEKYATDLSSKVTFHYPEEWRKTLTLPVQGYGVGLVHGDDCNRPDSIPDWWSKQVHGGGPLAQADILISGHFHTFRFQPSGRNFAGKQKWWVAAPTLDNGSDWYANGNGGYDSDPGLLAFVVDKEKGLDFQSFTIL